MVRMMGVLIERLGHVSLKCAWLRNPARMLQPWPTCGLEESPPVWQAPTHVEDGPEVRHPFDMRARTQRMGRTRIR